jgi:hypothetical protein
LSKYLPGINPRPTNQKHCKNGIIARSAAKKTQKTPRKEIVQAMKKAKEVQ